MREHGVPQFTVDAHRPVARLRRARRLASPPSSATPTCSPRSTWPASRCSAKDRTDEHPIVIAGGHAAFNPEPIADFIDAAVLGDGEQAVLAITDVVSAWKAEGRPGGRDELLLRLAETGGVYVPRVLRRRLPARRPDPAGRAEPPPACRGGWPSTPSWTSTRGRTRSSRWCRSPRRVHERMSVEIFRGCTRGCRFCQAGMITRPVRERSITGIGEMVERGLAATGFEEVGLLSLSSADHSRDRRHRQGPGRPLRGHPDRPVACPVTRVDAFNIDLANELVPQRPPLRADLRPRGRLASGCARSSTRWSPRRT